jgi:hypothetical protein
MKTFMTLFVGFWVVWIIWYVTGGPLRDDKTKPYVMVTPTGQFERTGGVNQK